jgi:hypothetical protein
MGGAHRKTPSRPGGGMIDKRLNEITREDLETLVSDQRQEGRTLDYKRDLALSSDEDKRELARDVSSFANAAGGDLVFGIEEAKDSDGKNLGYPAKLVGVECPNFDATKLRFESIVRDNIDPKISGLAFYLVPDFEHGPIIIVRVPQSWNGPHMVSYKNQTHFYSRNNSGKHGLDVREIRAAFLGSTEVEQRVRRFRDERLGRLVANEAPVTLQTDWQVKVITHAMPISFGPVSIDLDTIADGTVMPPPYSKYGADGRYNLDGYVSVHASATPEYFCYNQAFRGGSFESVSLAHLHKGPEEGRCPRLLALSVERDIARAARLFCSLLRRHGFDGPIAIFASLIGAKGATVVASDDGWSLPAHAEHPIDRDVLTLPDALVEGDGSDLHARLRPVFDTLWQASGWERSPGYDAQGAWLPAKHT